MLTHQGPASIYGIDLTRMEGKAPISRLSICTHMSIDLTRMECKAASESHVDFASSAYRFNQNGM